MKNLFSKCNWRTSAIGMLIAACILLSMGAVFMGKASLLEAGSFLGIAVGALTAIGFLSTRDDVSPVAILVLLIPVLMVSCTTPNKCARLFPPTTSTQTVIKDSFKDSIIAGSQVGMLIPWYDILGFAGKNQSDFMLPKVPFLGAKVTDPTNSTTLELIPTAQGLQANAITNPRTIKLTTRTIVTHRETQRPVEVLKTPWWVIPSITLLSATTIYLFIKNRI